MWLKGDDYKIEAMVAFRLENLEGNADQVIIQPAGTFKRDYDHDVINITKFENSFLAEISREGLYDMLPEGLFHEGRTKAQKSTEEAVKESVRYREEEKAARKFFLPLEQEFYQQKIYLEHLELKASLNSMQSDNVSFLLDFWGIEKGLFSSEQNHLFFALLPNLYRIACNLNSCTYCLEAIMGAPVKIEVIEDCNSLEIDHCSIQTMGELILGVDSIVGDCYEDQSPALKITLTTTTEKLENFLPGNIADRQMKILFNFLFPADVDIQLSILVADELSCFRLKETEEGKARLGYTCII